MTNFKIFDLNLDKSFDKGLCIDKSVLDDNEIMNIIKRAQEESLDPSKVLVGIMDITSPIMTQYYRLSDITDNYYIDNILNIDSIDVLSQTAMFAAYNNCKYGDLNPMNSGK